MSAEVQVIEVEGQQRYLLPEDLIFTKLVYTAEEFSELIDNVVSADWIRRRTQAGEIQCTYIGRSPRYTRADIELFLLARRQRATRKPQ